MAYFKSPKPSFRIIKTFFDLWQKGLTGIIFVVIEVKIYFMRGGKSDETRL